MDEYMIEAVNEASRGIDMGHGGPFGAVVVNDGGIVHRAHNRVLVDNDPTAHAEILAIRGAARRLGTFDLSGCEIYSTTEPCPMCMAAIYWSRIDALHFATDRDDAAEMGFVDRDIYEILSGDKENDRFIIHRMGSVAAESLMSKWAEVERTIY